MKNMNDQYKSSTVRLISHNDCMSNQVFINTTNNKQASPQWNFDNPLRSAVSGGTSGNKSDFSPSKNLIRPSEDFSRSCIPDTNYDDELNCSNAYEVALIG